MHALKIKFGLPAVMLLAALLAGLLASRHLLWGDEVFSLAIATGHSLEHMTAEADPSQGDFVMAAGAQSSADWQRYLEAPSGGTSVRQIFRAALHSDTSPPFYYLLLAAWISVFGTSDFAVRALTVVLFTATVPVMAALASRIGGRRAALPAAIFFATCPHAVYYGSEARMYGLMWFLLAVTALAAAGARTARRSRRVWWLAAFVLGTVLGLVTHYFFLFPWCALPVWLLWRPGRLRRWHLGVALAIAGAVLLPWYLQVPEMLRRPRIAQDWLAWRPDGFSRRRALLNLLQRYFTGLYGWTAQFPTLLAMLTLTAGAGAVIWRARQRGWRHARWLLPALWFAAGCAGPFVFDLLLHSYTAAIARYASGTMLAAMLLLALVAATLPGRARIGFVALMLVAWSAALQTTWFRSDRSSFPISQIVRFVEDPGADALVIVHGIPSGLLAVARYAPLEHLASWIGQLRQRRVPDDIVALTTSHREVVFVSLMAVHEPAPEEEWLRLNFSVVREENWGGNRAVWFRAPATAAPGR